MRMPLLAMATGNFTNIATNNAADGVYTLDGEVVAIGDIIDLGSSVSSFDPVLDIDSGGIKAREQDGAFLTRWFSIKAPLLETLLADGFTFVANIYAGSSISVSLSEHDDNYQYDVGGWVVHNPEIPDLQIESGSLSVTDINGDGPTDSSQFPPFNEESVFALTCVADRVSACLNGGEVVTTGGAGIDAALQQITIYMGGEADARLRSFAFYAPVDDAALVALSA